MFHIFERCFTYLSDVSDELSEISFMGTLVITPRASPLLWIKSKMRERGLGNATGLVSEKKGATMTSSLTSSFQCCNLRSVFLGEKSGIHAASVPVSRVTVFRSRIECKESRIGKHPIDVPSNVTIMLEGQDLKVKGPLGELSRSYPREVKVEKVESGQLKVTKALDTRRANQMHGLFRTLTDNMVVGVSKGFDKKLLLVGVGYRAALENRELVLYLGFSHPVKMQLPDGIQVKVEDNTTITVSGYDKCAIGEFAATIRKWRPPEPYKGKGIRYADEIVRRKEGKAGKKK